ncbi:putative WRKY transcription factor 41 [Forsythia ovata]|uniref:WRKY transcription factor 41 n=1 Tax=Forsythia ovata TaxID=205694 RepID=A0ABD1Q159_9LAMI
MEKVGSWDREIVISELTQGRDLATELKNQLQPAKSRKACGLLLEKILSSYDNALSVLNCMAFLGGEPSPINGLLTSASPTSSEASLDHVSKKRKTLAKWSKQVRVCTGTGLEGPLDDGYSWRKYGQKDILGAKFPRAYYRCTHRNTQGCLATKQVQRTDEDPSIFEVTYRGRHSCIQERLKQKKEIQRLEPQQKTIILKNETQELDTKEEIFPSFSFPSTPIESDVVGNELFSEPVKEINFSASYSPPFLSPTTPESYFSRMNDIGIDHNLQTSESDFIEIISNSTSVTNSPFGDLDFSIDPVDFDPKFLDTFEYF